MAISIDGVIGFPAQVVKLREKRTELLAGNLANADTPGYKARDFDFKQAMAQVQSPAAAQPSKMTVTHAKHIAPDDGGLGAELMYRTPLQPSIDGNTVDPHIEKAKFTENAMRQQASLTFLNSKIKGMTRAIRGE